MSGFKRFLYVVRADVMYYKDLSSFHLVSRDSSKPTQFNTTRLASFNSFVFLGNKTEEVIKLYQRRKKFKETVRVVHFLADWEDQYDKTSLRCK